MKKNTKKGFTLVELLVVIAILAILASVSVVGYTAFINKAELSNAQTEAAQISDIISSALIGNDYVIVKKTTTGEGEEAVTSYIYAVEDDGNVKFYAELPATVTGTKHVDLSDDLAGFAAKLELNGTALDYKYSDKVTVNAMTGDKK